MGFASTQTTIPWPLSGYGQVSLLLIADTIIAREVENWCTVCDNGSYVWPVHVRYTDCLQGLCSLWSSSVLFQCLLHSRMMYDADISLVFVAACSAHFFDQQLVISYDSSLSFWPLISLRTSTLEMLLLRLSVLNVFSSDTIQGPPVYRDHCMLVYVLPQCY